MTGFTYSTCNFLLRPGNIIHKLDKIIKYIDITNSNLLEFTLNMLRSKMYYFIGYSKIECSRLPHIRDYTVCECVHYTVCVKK